MPTTLTTRSIRLDDGTLYRPTIRRVLNYSTLSSGTTGLSEVFETHEFAIARFDANSGTHAANSTVTISCISGSVSSDVAAVSAHTALGSSGNNAFAMSSSAGRNGYFTGLDRYTLFRLIEAGGSTSQDVTVHVEFI